jgi:hypothetical protein
MPVSPSLAKLAMRGSSPVWGNTSTHPLPSGEGRKARFIDTGAALRRQVGDPVMRREIESVLGRRDELKYGGNTAGSLDPAEKNRVVAVLEKFSANHD